MRTNSLISGLSAGMRVYAAGLTGESALLREQLLLHPWMAAGVDFTSVQLPGVDLTNYLAIHSQSTAKTFFMTPALRGQIASGRAALHPLDYTGIARHLLEAPAYDVAIAQFTPPDAAGWCSPALSADFTPLVWARAKLRVGHLNPVLPRFDSSFRVHVSEFDSLVEAPAPLFTVATPASTQVSEAIGRHAASLVRDGDTLQFGIGSVPREVALALTSHRGLRIHSGMVSPLLETLWESGSLDRDARIVTGVLLGDERFYQYAESVGRIFLDDVRQTHALQVLSSFQRFVAINSALEVDLFGQVNSERTVGVVQAGAGGLPAYAQASQLARGGRLLICLPATASCGRISRIVPCLNEHGLCTVPRHLTDAVITEFGVAQLRDLTLNERAEALIAIAHPTHRAWLAASWKGVLKRV